MIRDSRQARRSRRLWSKWSGQRFFRQRLPQLNAVTIRVHDPAKSSVLVFLDLWVDPYTFITQGLQRYVEIVHDVIHHQGRFTLAKVRRSRRKNAPRREVIFGRTVWLIPEEHGPSVALADNAKMPRIPSAESFWVFRFEKNSADAADTGHGRYAIRPFPLNQRVRRRRAKGRLNTER